MRVLITRPEREATQLAAALRERGHEAVIAPLFHLQFVAPPTDFAGRLAACQAVLLTSANGARALAEASEARNRPILAVGDTTAATAEGLGFTTVTSANGDGAALVELARQRLDPKAGPLLHVAGREVAVDLDQALAPAGFTVERVTLYEARQAEALPEPARAALHARAVDAIPFFSPRASSLFARLAAEAGLADSVRDITAIAISPAALAPLADLPFKSAVAAARPTRQAVLDEIDRLAEAGVQGAIMSDAPDSASPAPAPAAPPKATPTPQVRRGLGVIGAFVVGVLASAAVLAGALYSLPYWPQEARELWRGPTMVPPAPPPPPPAIDRQVLRSDAEAAAKAAVETARRDLGTRLDDLDKRIRALSAERPAAPAAPAAADPALAELRSRLEALENRPTTAGTAPLSSSETEKEVATLGRELAALRTALAALEQSMAAQRDQTKALSDAVGAKSGGEQKALTAARGSALIGIAARLSAALDAGAPFAHDLDLVGPLAQGDAKLGEIIAALQPLAKSGVVSRAALDAEFPAVAKAALAEDLADDSYTERLLVKLKGLVSLRRVGDVPGDTTEAKLARAELALHAGDLAKAVGLVKSLPPLTGKATAAWLAKAEAHLAAKRAVDQLAAYAVGLLGTAR
ncbi:MAG: hypothetical protein FJX11_23595 [Alphaproteobacteria bacterium]|nr:hypothetical protein [Alphaproteobacteria bacterium]